MLRRLLVAGCLYACALVACAQADATRQLHALFERYWQQTARDDPEWATWRGDHRYDDRLSDASPAAREARDAQQRAWYAEAQAIDPAGLAPTDRISRALFLHGRAEAVAMQAHPGWRTMSLSSDGGFHAELPELLQAMPMDTPAQLQAVLARLAAVPQRIDQEIAWLQQGVALGWVQSRPVIERVLQQIDSQLRASIEESPWLEPLRRIGPGIPPARQQAARREAETLVRQQLLPALQRLHDFIAGPYLRDAPASGALSGYPGGARVYELLIAEHTTLPLDARALHETGLREVARLSAEIEGTARDAGYGGRLAEWVARLHSDPSQYHPSGTALLTGYRDIAKRIDPELSRLFAELPRTPYGVRAMPTSTVPTRPSTTSRRRSMAAAPAGSMPTRWASAASRAGRWPRWWRTKRYPATTCKWRGPSNSGICPRSAASWVSPPSSKAGRCMPRRSGWRSACIPMRPAASATCRCRSFARRGWWSTPACMPSAGRVSRPSTTWWPPPGSTAPSAPPRWTATPRRRARRWPT